MLENDPLRDGYVKSLKKRPLAEDLALLQKASDLLTDVGVVGVSEQGV